jgi:hypothetical protein
MPKIATTLAALFLIVGAFAVATPAQARWHHGWHGGSHFAFGWGGYPYPYYYGGSYYAAPACGWTHYRVWRHGHWVIRRAWRC